MEIKLDQQPKFRVQTGRFILTLANGVQGRVCSFRILPGDVVAVVSAERGGESRYDFSQVKRLERLE